MTGPKTALTVSATVKGAQAKAATIFHARRQAPVDPKLVGEFTQGTETSGDGLVTQLEFDVYVEVKNSMKAALSSAVDGGRPPEEVDYVKGAYASPAARSALHAVLTAQIIGKQTPIVDVPVFRGHLIFVEVYSAVYREIRRVLSADERAKVILPGELTLRFVGKQPRSYKGPEVSEKEAVRKVRLATAAEVADPVEPSQGGEATTAGATS